MRSRENKPNSHQIKMQPFVQSWYILPMDCSLSRALENHTYGDMLQKRNYNGIDYDRKSLVYSREYGLSF